MLAEAYNETRKEDFEILKWALAHAMWAAGCTWKRGTTPKTFMRQWRERRVPEVAGELTPMQQAYQNWQRDNERASRQ